MNLANHLIRAGCVYRDRPAVAIGSTVLWNYGELANRTARIAGALRGQFRLSPGDRVALLLHNCPEYLEILFSIWHAGAVAVPISSRLHAREAAGLLQASDAKACFATRDVAEGLAGCLEGGGPLVVVGEPDDDVLLEAPPVAPVARDPG